MELQSRRSMQLLASEIILENCKLRCIFEKSKNILYVGYIVYMFYSGHVCGISHYTCFSCSQLANDCDDDHKHVRSRNSFVFDWGVHHLVR